MPRPHGSDERSTLKFDVASDVSKEDVEELFRTVGGLVEVMLIRKRRKNKKIAFVEYDNEASASKAMQEFNNTVLKGNKITISLSEVGTKQLVDFHGEVEQGSKGTSNSKSQEDVISYTIGDEEGYINFIAKLRRTFASRKGDVVDIFKDDRNRPCAHPLLVGKPSDKKAVTWIHVELCEKGMGMQTTLAVRKDNLYVKGFKNKEGQWFELTGHADNNDWKLPKEYGATELEGWDVSYRGIMKLNNKDQVKKTLMSTRLGKAFAARAVRRLSRYPVPDDDDDNDYDTNPIRLGLAGLIVMICEAARMNPFLDTIAGGWNGGTRLTTRLADIMWDWGSMSAALLKWKKSREWPIKCQYSLGYALASIHLVLDSTDVTGSGPTWVEIFAVSANFPVTSVTVIDEAKCKNTIYNKQETEQVQEGQGQQEQETEQVQKKQTQQGMVPLELSVKGRRISGYESFGMEVVIPPCVGSGDSITKSFKWDCRNQDAVTELVARTINLDSRRKIDVTYLVMHNVVEAKVKVQLWLTKYLRPDEIPTEYKTVGLKLMREDIKKMAEGKKYTACGEITAQIDGLEDHRIVLFRSAVEVEFPLDLEPSILMRSVVSVPLGKRLHIDMTALQITEAPDDRVIKTPGRLSFDIGRSTPMVTSTEGDQVHGNIIQIEVNVAWPAQDKTIEKEPDVVFIIGEDRKKFTTSIENLRRVLASHPDHEDALDGYTGEALPDTGKHPVLARMQRPNKQPPRWIHVKLQVVAGNGEEMSSTTLALRDDTCSGAGFMNQNGVWYDLVKDHWLWPDGGKLLPPEYNSVSLGWDADSYRDILDYCICRNNGVVGELNSRRLGKDFARAAVRTLSRYPDVEEPEKPKLALAGLFIMVCESARFNHIFKSIVTGWDIGMEFTEQLYDYTLIWSWISEVLLRWKDHGYNSNRWPSRNAQLQKMGINCPADALRIVCLVFNVNVDNRTTKIDIMEYIVEDKEGFTTFIKKLRDVLAHHDHQEGILDGHPNPESVSTLNNSAVLARPRRYRWPARLIHIKLQLVEEETSTTLAVRDDNAYLIGFMNQKGVWYDLGIATEEGGEDKRLPPEFNPEPLNWGSYEDILGIGDKPPCIILRYNQGKDVISNKKDVDVSVWDEVREKLGTEGLGKDFAMKAVRTLSRYPDVEEDDLNPRLALAGLSIMVCESARLGPVHRHIEDGWDDTGTAGFPAKLMEYIQKSGLISQALRIWKDDHGYDDDEWLHCGDLPFWAIGYFSSDPGETLLSMGIHGPKDALNVVHLVPQLWD